MTRSTHRFLAKLVSSAAERIGLLSAIRKRRLRRGDRRLFILEYHDISFDGTRPGKSAVTTSRFKDQVEVLSGSYSLESLEQVVSQMGDSHTFPDDILVVTFDDGYLSNYELAWPNLASQGVPATIFLTTSFLDGIPLWFDLAREALEFLRSHTEAVSYRVKRELLRTFGYWPRFKTVDGEIEFLKYQSGAKRQSLLSALEDSDVPLPSPTRALTWGQVREMKTSGMISFGAHTVSHPILSTLSRPDQEREIEESATRILEETGQRPSCFAYPNGSARDFTSETIEILSSRGFSSACTTVRGSNRPDADLLRLRRIGVGEDSNVLLKARLSGLFDSELRRWIGA